MSKFHERAEAQTKQMIGQMPGDELLVQEGKKQQEVGGRPSGCGRSAAWTATARLPMKSKHIAADAEAQVHIIILDTGEEAFAALTRFTNESGISAASLTAIGAFERATVGWFDIASKSYRRIEVNEQCEVLSAIGDVAIGDDGKPSLHVHIVLGLADGSTRGGHLLAGTVRPTLEVVLTEVPATLRRKKRANLGIALIDLGTVGG
jgi:predicted DNA-binding protein with PD1-like motif